MSDDAYKDMLNDEAQAEREEILESVLTIQDLLEAEISWQRKELN